MLKFLKLLSIVLLFLIHGNLFSQGVALVLSGGGAKAYAHIGVLKALEENNIPIDYIIGSSMGALIGGLYSSGYTVDQIAELLTDPKFLTIAVSKENNFKCLYQQNEPNASFVTLPFNIDKGFNLQIPLKMYDLQRVDYALMEYFSQPSVLAKNNFDSLMIPFRCVAADIDSTKLVVLKEGDLAKSIRASMTFPLLIRPVEINKVLLFDGGMYDNFPVKEAVAEFKPAFIIGSKTVDNFSKPNADDAISLLQSMLMSKADFKVDSTIGLVIETRSGDKSIFNFTDVDTYIKNGYDAAIKMMPELLRRTKTYDNSKAINIKRADYKNKLPNYNIGNITISGLSNRQSSYFLKIISSSNKFTNPSDLFNMYSRLLANENVKNIYPELKYNADRQNFDLNLIITKTEPFDLQAGGYISSSGVNEGYVEFGYGSLGKTAKHISISSYFGTYYNSIAAMGNIEFPNRIPVYLRLNMLVSRRNYFSNARYFYEDKFPAYIIADENYIDFSVGIPTSKYGYVSAGITNVNAYFQYYKDNQFSRTDTADVSSFYFLTPTLDFNVESLNRKQFSSEGQSLHVGISYYNGDEKYTSYSGKSNVDEQEKSLSYFVLLFNYLKYSKLTNRVSVGISSEFNISSKPLLSTYISSLLIATQYEPIPVMKTLFLENYRAATFGSVGATVVYNFYSKFDLRFSGYYYVPYKKIMQNTVDNTAYLSRSFSHHYILGAATLIYSPPIGNISVSVNYIDKPGSKVSFLVNLGYLIFNKSKLNR